MNNTTNRSNSPFIPKINISNNTLKKKSNKNIFNANKINLKKIELNKTSNNDENDFGINEIPNINNKELNVSLLTSKSKSKTKTSKRLTIINSSKI
jgi:hypothetical protein